MKKITITMALLGLSACSPTMDMQGVDPREYYTQHPIKETVETHHKLVELQYAAGQERLSPSEIDNLTESLHPISLLAIDSIQISSPVDDFMDKVRTQHLKKLLRNMGYSNGKYTYRQSSALKSGEMQLDISYSVAVAPDCPDWRTSPVTTHSNTMQGNFGCAQQVNFGLMVADPHDLVRGTGDVPIDTPTADKAIQDFHEGRGASAPGTTAPASAGGSTGAPTPTTGQ